jgi:transcriptional regulator with XRE-family HTH domain
MEIDTTDPRPLATARLPLGGVPADPTYCEWGAAVGGRIRRLRRQRRATLRDLGRALRRPNGSCYSAGFISRLERGQTSAAFYVYLAIADALEVDPGVLMGPDATLSDLSEAEAVLIRVLRRLEIEPDDAVLRITGAPAPP